MQATPTVQQALLQVLSRPWDALVIHWNWKAALFSAVSRGMIFLATNLHGGLEAAVGAMWLEAAFRTAMTGVYAAFVQALRFARPAWLALITVMIILPAIIHVLEFVVHWLSTTPAVGASVAASIAFSIISALFNMYAMRRGALLVGAEGRSLVSDVLAMPGLLLGFMAAGPMALWRALRVSASALVPERLGKEGGQDGESES